MSCQHVVMTYVKVSTTSKYLLKKHLSKSLKNKLT